MHTVTVNHSDTVHNVLQIILHKFMNVVHVFRNWSSKQGYMVWLSLMCSFILWCKHTHSCQVLIGIFRLATQNRGKKCCCAHCARQLFSVRPVSSHILSMVTMVHRVFPKSKGCFSNMMRGKRSSCKSSKKIWHHRTCVANLKLCNVLNCNYNVMHVFDWTSNHSCNIVNYLCICLFFQ